MTTVDFNQIARNYEALFSQKHAKKGDPLKGASLHLPDVACVQLEAKDISWDPDRCQSVDQVLAKAERHMVIERSITLTRGICRGVLNKVRLTPPSGISADNIVSVDPCKTGAQTLDHPPTPMKVDSEPPRSSQASSPQTKLVQKKYTGTFFCHVYPSGHVAYDGTNDGTNDTLSGAIKVQSMIEELYNKRDPSVRAFNKKSAKGKDKFYFEMEGELEYTHDAEMKITYYK